MKAYMLIPKISIHNANAMSSTYTIGFPAMTAWLGAVHALQRKIAKQDGFSDLKLVKTAVVCHECNLQVYKGMGDYKKSIIATANPLRKKGADFERPPFIEEARVHVVVSLLIEVQGVNGDNDKVFLKAVQQQVPSMKMASGDIMGFEKAQMIYVDENQLQAMKKVLFKLMPGYVIIERSDLMLKESENGTDRLDALLDVLKIHHMAEIDAEGIVSGWKHEKTCSGWLVPISIGFKGISPLGIVSEQRDATKRHRFVENVVTVGEFKMAHRFENIEEIMWHYNYDETNTMYICKNQQ
ncbi:type I-F CRISPR-associated protein Csy2 [Megasphaera sueciensis]|jgi:CRISPR-associated protein Csy2|uniref:type I-F CRISPR-associated protein Csy2 n=1 Tax=Megasphaera sueciensis TaxID=349094 RepID=UPI003D058B03